MRGYAAGVVRASTFGLEPGYVDKANDNLLIVLQIESAAAVEHAAEICAVEGVDVVFIGVNDLARLDRSARAAGPSRRAQPGATGRGRHSRLRQADGHGAERRRLVAGAVRARLPHGGRARTTSFCCARPPAPPGASIARFAGTLPSMPRPRRPARPTDRRGGSSGERSGRYVQPIGRVTHQRPEFSADPRVIGIEP